MVKTTFGYDLQNVQLGKNRRVSSREMMLACCCPECGHTEMYLEYYNEEYSVVCAYCGYCLWGCLD